jgi:putative sterol carrier protein
MLNLRIIASSLQLFGEVRSCADEAGIGSGMASRYFTTESEPVQKAEKCATKCEVRNFGLRLEEGWLVVDPEKSEVCLKDPGKDIDVYFNCSVQTLSDIWMGDRTYRDAIKSGDLMMEGDPSLTRNVTAWLRPGFFANSPREHLPA